MARVKAVAAHRSAMADISPSDRVDDLFLGVSGGFPGMFGRLRDHKLGISRRMSMPPGGGAPFPDKRTGDLRQVPTPPAERRTSGKTSGSPCQQATLLVRGLQRSQLQSPRRPRLDHRWAAHPGSLAAQPTIEWPGESYVATATRHAAIALAAGPVPTASAEECRRPGSPRSKAWPDAL